MDPNIWIGDTAATVHMTPHEEGMVNMKNTRGGITVGNGEVMVAKKTGDIPCELCDRHGNLVHSGRITDVALIKSCPFNLFSVTKMMREGWKLSGDGDNGITLSKGGNNLSFDIPVATPKGVLYVMYVRRSEIANPALVTTMTVEKAHCLLGHQSEDTTRKIAKYIGWEITKGALKPCLSCSIGKAKQKNTVKDSDHAKCKAPGERIFTDIASVRPAEGMKVSKPYWCIKVDERTQMKFSSFHAHKDDMVESSCELFQKWKHQGNPVQYIRCDNAGENKSLQKKANSADWKLNITFEYTPRDTPQHNHFAELGLASIANKGRSLMSAANDPMKIRYKVWIKAFQHATDLDGLVVTEIDGSTATRYEHWNGKVPKWVKHMRTWGESGTVKVKTDTTPKIADRGIQCMYSNDHDGDCYEMWYPQTNRIYTTRDVIWIKRMYYSEDKIMLEAAANVVQIENVGMEEVNAKEEEKEGKNDEQPAVTEDGYPAGTLRSGTTYRDIAAANLAQFPLQLTQAEENYLNYMKECNEIACVGAGIGGGFEHTTELHVMYLTQH
jgi:hypothetical protein